MAVFLGIAFVLIGIRLLPKLVYEIALFGAVFGLPQIWHYWGSAFLNLPELPIAILQFTAAGALAWALLRIMFILSLFPSPIQPILRMFSTFVNGR